MLARWRTIGRRTLVGVAPVIGLLSVATVAATRPASISPRSAAYENAKAWVEKHRESLPTTFSEISSLPMLE